ncbi:MAG: tetratricopeptide repeat protein, partial [Candidatus Latescibacterota bacterium]|nr:tetratricopeptide repeat protein [Candidatus Latescibacterota bacterium]
SYGVNYSLGGLDPMGYHLLNGLLHAANAVWVLLLAWGLGLGRSPSFAAALLFAVHPLNSEVVHYASSRSEALMAFFFLAACWAYLRHGASGRWNWYGLALCCGGLAMLSKSVAVVLGAVLVLCDWLVGRDLRKYWPRYLPFAVLALCYALFSRALVGKALLAPVRPLDVQVWTQIKGALYYALIGVMPFKLSVEHQFYPSSSLGEPAVVGAGLLLLSLGWLLWRSGWRIPIFASGWATVLLGPTFVVPLIVLVNEHRLYLSMAGWCLLVAWLFEQLAVRGSRVALCGLATYTILLAIFTLERGWAWSDELALWSDAAAKAPGMLKPHLRLGDALKKRGRLAEAEATYLRALALRPYHPATRNNLGVLYKQQGRLAAAETQFRTLLAASPDIVHARLNLAELVLRQGLWREAETECLQALEFADTGGEAQKMLALIALHYRSDPEQALTYSEVGLALAPDAAAWTTRGVALKALDRGREAEISYRRALEFEPGAIDTWYNLGNLYREMGQVDQALSAYAKVVALGRDTSLGTRAKKQIAELNTTR